MNKQTIKNQLIALIFFIFICNYSQSEIIKDVVIEGNKRVNSETIKIFGGFSIGDDLNKDDLNRILKDLYETNFFENVSLKLDNSTLKISIVENPIIQNLLINGVENDSLKEKLFENISLKEKNPYVENDVRNNLSNIHEIWPNLELYLHGGVHISPYMQKLKELMPSSKMNFFSNYNGNNGYKWKYCSFFRYGWSSFYC